MSEIASQVRAAWETTLGHRDFGDDDDFFAVGGHSLLVARIMATLGRHVGRRLSLRMFFDHPTVNLLAEAVSATARPDQAAGQVNAR